MSGNGYFLEARNLGVNFLLRAGVLRAVQGVNLFLRSGETIGIVGESGSGKSVMARSIIRLNPTPPAQTTGQVLVDGTDVYKRQIRVWRFR